MRVYFAGPLFTPYERSFIDECTARLRAEGIEVFVPHENALALPDTKPATIFAKGFLREYAKYVGLDPDEVVNFYLTAEQRHRAEHGTDDVSGIHPVPAHGYNSGLSLADATFSGRLAGIAAAKGGD